MVCMFTLIHLGIVTLISYMYRYRYTSSGGLHGYSLGLRSELSSRERQTYS